MGQAYPYEDYHLDALMRRRKITTCLIEEEDYHLPVFSKIAVVFLYFSFLLFLDGAFCFLIKIIIIII